MADSAKTVTHLTSSFHLHWQVSYDSNSTKAETAQVHYLRIRRGSTSIETDHVLLSLYYILGPLIVAVVDITYEPRSGT